MSDLSRTIAIIFSGIDELSGPISEIESKLSTFSSHVETLATPLAGAADNILKLDAAISVLAAGGLVHAFNASVEFESAVIELEKVLGGGLGVDEAIAEATRLSEIYGQSASSILLNIADFKQAGFSLADSLTLTVDALDLVIAGNLSAAQSSESIIAALKGFGLEANSARTYIDILNEVSNNYATDIEQLATGMAALSPIANTMGFSMQEAAGLLTPIIEVFRSGDEAANALKTGLLKLIDDSKPVADALASIGVSQKDANGELRAGRDIYIDVATAFQGLDEKQKLFITSQLVGMEQSAKMVTVFDNLKLSTEIAATAFGSAGSAAKEVAARLESAEVSIDRFKVGFENLSRTIGDQFRIATVSAIDGGTEIETALRNMIGDGTFDPIFEVINSFATKVGTLLSTVAKNLPEAFEGIDFDGLLDALGDIGDSIGDIFDDVDLTTPEGLHEVIQTVINTLASLATTTAGMVDAFRPFIQNIAGMISSFNEMDEASKKSAGEILGLAKAIVDLGPGFAMAILAVGDAASSLAAPFMIAINAISSFFDGVAVTWDTLALSVFKVASDILGAMAMVTFGDLSKTFSDSQKVVDGWADSTEQSLKENADAFMKHATGIETNFAGIGGSADDATKKVEGVTTELEKVPDEKTTTVDAQVDSESIAGVGDKISEAAPDEKTTAFKGKTDKTSLVGVESAFQSAAPAEKTTNFKATSSGVDTVKKEVESIPENKMIEIQLQGDIDIELARINATMSEMNTTIEWTAKMNIAEIQADAEVAKAAYASVASSVTATASAAADMFSALMGAWGDIDSYSERSNLMSMVKEQMAMEQQALNMQKDLISSQISYLEAKADALSKGDGMIKITSDGLEPYIEAFMFKILEKIQVRVNEEGLDMLIGSDL